MADLRSRILGQARETVSGELYQLGHTPKSLEETQREVLWWVYARVQAAMNLNPRMIAGWGVAWTSAGYAELVPIEVPRAGRDRVTVEVLFSAVSPGTERAQYLNLPNAQVGVLGRPGYSAAGRVIAAGPGAKQFRAGDLVALTGAAHASVVTVPAGHVFRIPDGVSAEHASLIMLGTICTHGAELAAAQPDERVAVVGAGPVGLLAFRIAGLSGIPSAIITHSRRSPELAGSSGAKLLATERDAEAVATVNADVVIEATGDPQAIAVAVSAAAPGGRVVLLGSPRGVTRGLPVREIQAKRLELIGAHIDTVDFGGENARRNVGERFLDLLSTGSLEVDDILGSPVDPRRAAVFYRELAERTRVGGAYFDWRLLSQADRRHRGHLVKPPSLTGRGMEAIRPYRPKKSAGTVFDLPDPFADAKGMLRLGILGCGDIAVHNAAGAAAAPNVRVTACFDPVPRLAEDLASRHGARAMRTQEELLMSPEVDAVLLAVPHDLHAPLAIEACRAGKNVIVEKPMARDLQGGLDMAAAARENGVWLSVCFPQRYEPKVQIAHRLIAAGAVGEVLGTMTSLYLDKSPAYWLGGFSGRVQSDWRRSKLRAGGGVLIMNLSHHLDLMRYLSGMEVAELTALIQPSDDIEDSVVANLRYGSNALGSLIGSASVRGSTEEEMSLWGSEGRLILMPEPRVYSMRPIPGVRGTRWNRFGRLPNANIRGTYLSRLGTAVSEGRPPEITADDGLAVQAIIEAVYLSGESGGAPVDPSELMAGERAAESVIG